MENETPIILISSDPADTHPNSESWMTSFIDHSIISILSSPSNPQEESYKSLVMRFASLLKQSITSNFPVDPSHFCEILNNYSLPEINLNFELSLPPSPVPLPHIQQLFPLSPNIEKENSDVLTEKKESPQITCTLYRRVLEILDFQNKTDSEIFGSIDMNKTGKINEVELRARLRYIDASITKEEAREVFKILDGDHDGFVSLEDLKKRKKLIEEKALEEVEDPLSCIVVSEPLAENQFHGNLLVKVLKVKIPKGGPRWLRCIMKGNLEYRSSDFIDDHFPDHTEYKFLIENLKPSAVPPTIELNLFNKNIIEGSASLNWMKSHNLASEFVHKSQIELRTSLNQPKGSLSLSVHWHPISPQKLSQKELQDLEDLKKSVEKYQFEVNSQKNKFRKMVHSHTEEFPNVEEFDDFKDEEVGFGNRCSMPERFFISSVSLRNAKSYNNSPRSPASPNQSFTFGTLSSDFQRKATIDDRPKTPQAPYRHAHGKSTLLNIPNKKVNNRSPSYLG